MLNSCKLFDKKGNGNYSKEEVEWYRGQMNEINDMVEKCKADRDAK
jgi:hypothetical protein